MNEADSPQGQACEREACEHEWVLCHQYDTDNDVSRSQVVCRVCGQNAGDNTGIVRIHETQGRFIQYPDSNWTLNHKQAYRFQGTGLNTWYPVED